MAKSKKDPVKRVRMTDAEKQAFAKRYVKAHDLKGKEITQRWFDVAIARLAALDRDGAKNAKKVTKIGKDKKAKKAHKKAA
jgi:L-rhamnose isomerase